MVLAAMRFGEDKSFCVDIAADDGDNEGKGWTGDGETVDPVDMTEVMASVVKAFGVVFLLMVQAVVMVTAVDK